MTAGIAAGAALVVVLITGCGSSPTPGPCQALAATDAQKLIDHNRYGVVKAAWVSTGRTSQGDPVSAVAISTYQNKTLTLGHAQSGGSFSGGFWVALDPATQAATGFPGRDDSVVGDIASAVHSDDAAAAKACL